MAVCNYVSGCGGKFYRRFYIHGGNSPVTSQIIMGGAPRAPAESKAFYNPTYTHILCFTVKCVLLRLVTGTDSVFFFIL